MDTTQETTRRYKRGKTIQMTLPPTLARRLDEYCEAMEHPRSRILAMALSEYLARHDQDRREAA